MKRLIFIGEHIKQAAKILFAEDARYTPQMAALRKVTFCMARPLHTDTAKAFLYVIRLLREFSPTSHRPFSAFS